MTEEELRGIPCRTWAMRLDAAERGMAQHARRLARLMLERDELRRQLEEMKADRDRLAAIVIDLSMQDESETMQLQSAT